VETPIAKPDRIVSLDIFRGLNIALMIFVNELAEIKGLPWWTYHAPGKVDVMTYVDMVFPGFLIIVGMSLPLAIGARIRRGDTTAKLVWYVVLRSVALLVLGIIITNGSSGDPLLMHGVGRFVWSLLALFAAGLVWFDYPQSTLPSRRRLYSTLRLCGLLLLLLLAVIFRQTSHGSVARLSYGYPEILGLIGYTYLVTGLCYLSTRKWRWAPAAWFLAFAAYNIASTAGVLRIRKPWYIWPVENGSMGALMFAGIVLSTIFFAEPRLGTFRKRTYAALTFGVLAAVAAWLTVPLGISKIRATPTWVLFTIAASCAVYVVLYWLCDVRKQRAWAAPVRSAGANTLTTYLLPDLWFYISGAVGWRWWNEHFNYGAQGVVRALVFTAIMLALSTLLTRWKVRLQL
jgi:heparan-alpha-glucosaminide N-acetyltransferase